MPTFDIFRAPNGNPEHDQSDHVGVVTADSMVEAIHIAGRKIVCRKPASLFARDGKVLVDDDSQIAVINDLP